MPTQRRAPTNQASILEDDKVSPSHTDLVKKEQDVAPASSSSSSAPQSRGPVVPAALHFPLAASISFIMASLGYSVLGELTKGELAGLSRTQDTWGEVAVLAGWRGLELALAWFGSLDGLDVAALDVLAHGPHYYLLSGFYGLSPVTAVSALTVDVVSIAVPFCLLRPLSAVHKPSAAAKLPNRELLDVGLQLYTAALSTAIYSVVLVLSLKFVLPRILVVYFSGVPTIEPAYTASYASVLPVTVLFGLAASTFIFAPFATTGKAKEDDKIAAFDPVEASLGQTVWWNVCGFTAKTKVVIYRTALAVLFSAITTYLSGSKTVYGIEVTGAAAYAGVWALAALCTGVGLGLVGIE